MVSAPHGWVRTFRPEYASAPREWLIFAPDGELTARATLPGDLTIMEIGQDYLLASQRDELDVEHVRLWTLSRGR